MRSSHGFVLVAALALGALPVSVPAGEASATSAAATRDAEKQLADARQKLEAAAQEVARLSGQMGQRFNFQLGLDPGQGPPRALLGVSVDGTAGREGARVADVSPGGAAAEAGIKAGDIITGIADTDLTKDSDPSRALVEKMRQLTPDQKVKVAVLRDGKKLSFDVTPRPAPFSVMSRREIFGGRGPDDRGGRGPGDRGPGAGGSPGGPGPNANVRDFRLQGQPGGRDMGGPDAMARLLERVGGSDPRLFDDARFGGAELASLSERLGSYFGVKTGVLVVRAGVDSPFKLQDGDVILAIDGREITTGQQAGRILRSYQPGEKLTLKVQRDRKLQTIEGTAPGGRQP
jgi:S1-C subfamily serine protease